MRICKKSFVLAFTFDCYSSLTHCTDEFSQLRVEQCTRTGDDGTALVMLLNHWIRSEKMLSIWEDIILRRERGELGLFQTFLQVAEDHGWCEILELLVGAEEASLVEGEMLGRDFLLKE